MWHSRCRISQHAPNNMGARSRQLGLRRLIAMPSGFMTRTMSAAFYRRLAPWAVVLLIGALLVRILPRAQAQPGASAADAIPIGPDGKFAGTAVPSSRPWRK